MNGSRKPTKEPPMPRPKSFTPALALDRAMDLFWARGYEATSIDDLVSHLNITRPALYREWGSKQGVYQAALKQYRTQAGASFLAALDSRPEDVIEIVRERLYEIASEALMSPDRRGCFVVNAACERSSSDPATSNQVEAAMLGLAGRIESALRVAIDREVLDHSDPATLARFIVVVIQGLRVVGKTRPEALAGVVDQAMAAATGRSHVVDEPASGG